MAGNQDIKQQIEGSVETEQSIREETLDAINTGNRILEFFKKTYGENSKKYRSALKEYEDIRLATIRSLRNESSEGRKITEQELNFIKLELSNLDNLKDKGESTDEEHRSFTGKTLDFLSPLAQSIGLTTDALSGLGYDTTNLNTNQDELIAEILGTEEKGYGNGYIKGYNNEIGNHLIEVIVFEKDLKNKSITSINSKALANYFEYLDSEDSKEILNIQTLIDKFGKYNLVELLNYWEKNPNTIAKKILKEKGIWGKIEEIQEAESSSMDSIRIYGKTETLSEKDIDSILESPGKIFTIEDEELLEKVLDEIKIRGGKEFIEEVLNKGENVRTKHFNLGSINPKLRGNISIIKKVIELGTRGSLSEIGINSIPKEFFQDKEKAYERMKELIKITYTYKTVFLKFSEAINDDNKIIEMIRNLLKEEELKEKNISMQIPRSILIKDKDNSMLLSENEIEMIEQMSITSEDFQRSYENLKFRDDNFNSGNLGNQNMSMIPRTSLSSIINRQPVSLLTGEEERGYNFSPAQGNESYDLKTINSFIEEKGIASNKNEIRDLIERGYFTKLSALSSKVSEYPELAALAVKKNPGNIMYLSFELRGNREVINSFINTEAPHHIKNYIQYIDIGSDLNLLFKIYEGLKTNLGEIGAEKLLLDKRVQYKILSCVEKNMEANGGKLMYSSLYEDEAKGVISIIGLVGSGVDSIGKIRDKISGIEVDEQIEEIKSSLTDIELTNQQLKDIIKAIKENDEDYKAFEKIITIFSNTEKAAKVVIALKKLDLRKKEEELKETEQSMKKDGIPEKYIIVNDNGESNINYEKIKTDFYLFLSNSEKQKDEDKDKYYERIIGLFTKEENLEEAKGIKDYLVKSLGIEEIKQIISDPDMYVKYLSGEITKEEYENKLIDNIKTPNGTTKNTPDVTEKTNNTHKIQTITETSSGNFTITTDTGKTIEITKKEKLLVENNQEALDNLINFKTTLDEINMGFIWTHREKYIRTMDNLNVQLDSDTISEEELRKILNYTLKVIGEEGEHNTLNSAIAKVKDINGAGLDEEAQNIFGRSKIEQKFWDKGYINPDVGLSIPKIRDEKNWTKETLGVYEVKPGDSLWKIARKNLEGTPNNTDIANKVNEIKKLNPELGKGDLIKPGQKLKLHHPKEKKD